MAPDCGNGGVLEHARWRLLILAAIGIGILAAWAWWARRPGQPVPPTIPGGSAPRITVEVLNETPLDGLARDVARRLRGRGIDVVYFGTATRHDRDSTVILVRRGDTTAAATVRRALGGGRIALELDPGRLLDASVLVGHDLAPALQRHP